MRLAVVPARGGSKRIPRKNIRPFAGKPMIRWSIETALESGCFDRIVVSTDDAEVAEAARAAGAEIPFMRPAELSDDFTATVPVIAHAVDWCAREGGRPEAVCCIYATAPFMRAADLRAGFDLLSRSGLDYVFPVGPLPCPVERTLTLSADGRVAMRHPEHVSTRSQDLPPAFHDAGQFYWGRAEAWTAGRPILSGLSGAIPLPHSRVHDIDTMEDWRRAEIAFRVLQESGE